MLIFVSGQYPIYGTQILYFKDPVLAKRALIPPPLRFFAIEEGRLVPQVPADRTRNVISAAEPRPGSSGMAAAAAEAELPAEETALWDAMGDHPAGTEARSSATGFIEQLDLDLHETGSQ